MDTPIGFHPDHLVPLPDPVIPAAVTVPVWCRECGAFELGSIETDDTLRCPSCGELHQCDACGALLCPAARAT